MELRLSIPQSIGAHAGEDFNSDACGACCSFLRSKRFHAAEVS
jgi:hypothetical protein